MKTTKTIMASWMFAAFLLTLIACDAKKGGHSSESSNTEVEKEEPKNKTDILAPDYSSVSDEVKDQVGKAFQDYLNLKNAFVTANHEEAKKAAQQLASDIEKVDASKIEGGAKAFISDNVSTIKQHADHIASDNDIEAQRNQLHTLSISLYLLLKSTGANPETIYYQYCPMAQNNEGGYWISESKDIKNPYFGDKMMTCGETKETLSKK